MNSEKMSKKRPVDTLTYKNWKEWFKLLKMYFVGEELDFVIYQTEVEYCTAQSEPGVRSEGGRLSPEKQRLYRKASAKVLYTITICVDSIDADLVSETATAKEVWDQLYTKYSKVRPQANRDDIKKITAFKLQEGTTIENAWTFLKTTRARIVTANKDFRHAFTEDMIFEHLLAGLPDDYSSTRANIDAQQHLTIQDKLDILVIQEERLSTDKAEKALAAQSTLRKSYGSKHRSKRDSGSGSESESESRQNLTCWICESRRHLARDCPTLSQFQTIIKQLTTASLRMEKSKAQSSERSAKGKTKSAKDKNMSASTSRRHYKRRDADSNSDASAESSSSAELDSDKEEIATFCQALSSSSTESDSDEEEIATFCQVLRNSQPLSRPKVGEFQLLQSEAVESRLLQPGNSLVDSIQSQHSRPGGVAAPVSSVQSWRSGSGGVADINIRLRTADIRKDPQTSERIRKHLETAANARKDSQTLATDCKRLERTADVRKGPQVLRTVCKQSVGIRSSPQTTVRSEEECWKDSYNPVIVAGHVDRPEC
jgi:hypothetical protein